MVYVRDGLMLSLGVRGGGETGSMEERQMLVGSLSLPGRQVLWAGPGFRMAVSVGRGRVYLRQHSGPESCMSFL